MTNVSASPPIRKMPQKKITRQQLVSMLADEPRKSLVVNIEQILSSKQAQFRLLIFLALLLFIILAIGDLIFILK